VLRVFRAQVAALRPGKTTKDFRTECEERIAKGMRDLGLLKLSQIKKQTPDSPAVRPFFMHGVSHPIGLDVHDVTYNHFKVEPGWCYRRAGHLHQDEGFGIRIENTIAVTETARWI